MTSRQSSKAGPLGDRLRPTGPKVFLNKLIRVMLSYRVLVLTILVSVAGGLLWALGRASIIQPLFSTYALTGAALLSARIVSELRRGRFGVDVLAVIALVATVFVGEYVASMIIVLMVSGGGALEAFAESRAQSDLSSLLASEPQVAHKLDVTTQEISDVGASEVRDGDSVVVKAGEVVPVDGTLVSASGSFDESSLTG